MRTERAWAIARADGSLELGEVPPNRFARIPVLRVIAGLIGALKLGIGRGMLRSGAAATDRVRVSRRRNLRFLVAMVLAEGALLLLNWSVARGGAPAWFEWVMTALPWVVVLGVLRLVTAPVLWRYHGAEHKAVAAHETGIDLSDTAAVLACSRVHNRCGTNLVFLLAVGTVALVAVPDVLQVPVFLLTLGACVEVMSLASSRPALVASRVLLAGGKVLQRYVTTAEPTPEEQAVGCRALMAALAEHARLEQAEPAPAVELVAA
jgi:uncharacterized protein YqhQ